MPFTKETATKYGHETKRGKSDKVKEIRSMYMNLIQGHIHTIQEDLDAMQPIDRLKMIISLSRFVLPTLKSVEVSNDKEHPVIPTIRFVNN